MAASRFLRPEISDSDLSFLLETTAPDVSDRLHMKEVLESDMDFRNAFLTEDKLLRRLLNTDDSLLRLSPGLFFEILLRHTRRAMGERSYTLEKEGLAQHIPVFDSAALVELLGDDAVVMYLAHMLTTFTRMESYTVGFRIGPGAWRKIRFNDMDVESLLHFAGSVDETHRLGLYKRIGDVCLFLLGIFPDFIETEHRYPFSGKPRPALPGRPRLSAAEYEAQGRQFYRRAAEHHSAAELELDAVFWKLHAEFEKARKPLTYIADHYLRHRRGLLFG